MIRFLKWFFTGDSHLHKWEILEKKPIVKSKTDTEVGIYYVLQCKVCGNVKVVKDMV